MAKYKGVNLGGWLILERWMTPRLFEGMSAPDEYSWCLEAGTSAASKLKSHRDTFITAEDLEWIAGRGLNAVRLPVPYWVFGDDQPYIACEEYVDWLLDECNRLNIGVLIDLHAAPGSQNGNDHSGRAGKIAWPELDNINRTLSVFAQLVEKYGSHAAVIGFESLNEPSPKIPVKLIREYYEQAAQIVTQRTPTKLILGHDAFRPKDWLNRNQDPNSFGLDMHLYQVFDRADKKLSLVKHVKKAKYEWSDLIATVSAQYGVVIGEWSLGLDTAAFRGMDDFERDKAVQAYGAAQLATFDAADGWFFWNYKTEDPGGWNFRESVRRGWLPASFN